MRYRELVREGVIVADPAQETLAERLDRLNKAIASVRLASKSSSLGWLFAKKAPRRDQVRGVYIHGSVGRGKSMLMDFFFRACPSRRKRRAHFHDFMADVHDRIAAHRAGVKDGSAKGDDPIAPVVAAIAEEARVLCFDEFTVTDIADAMILSRLFAALFQHGVVLVATSNVAPDDLYRDGLNRGLFLPFVDLLKDHADVFSLDAERDYRLGRLARTPLYRTPLGPETEMAMEATWVALTGGIATPPDAITVKGRQITVPAAAFGAARFGFADLCETPLGARDYLTIARSYHTLMVENVPVIGDGKRNEAKRFINLIDTLYDNRNKLVVSAAAEPGELYQARSGTEAFEFERTASRLIEMRSEDWVAATKPMAKAS
ncbi:MULTISPECIES: cell division protein ZapE [unclassified Roseitalea]|uniref:cell division protein ZapE n=1 Tax=unclassified Roseitalea TaxID=2639107 RepID=UPI00273CF535|nr:MULTISPECIES: cell division protein ZapE [unclassified Roseitalea]